MTCPPKTGPNIVLGSGEENLLKEAGQGHNEVHIVELNAEFKPCRYSIVRRLVTGTGQKVKHFEDREEIDLDSVHEI